MHSKTISKAKSKKKSKTNKALANQVQNLTDILNEEVVTITDRHQPVLRQSSSSSNTATSTTNNDQALGDSPVANDLQEEPDNIINHSVVWNYATKLKNGKAECNKCKKEISCKDHSTTGLRRHLNRCVDGLNLRSSTKVTSKPTISNETKKRLHELVYQCIIQDGRSFGDLRKPGMTRLLEEIVPGYKPPTRRTVQRQLKRLSYNHTKKLINKLKNVDAIAVTTDLWSDRKLNSYMCVTGHYLNLDTKLDSTVLSFTAFHERHTGEQIACTIKKELKRLQIYEKTHTITADGAANVRKAFKSLEPKRIHCMGHKLHLVVCNALCLWVKEPESTESLTTDEATNGNNKDVNTTSNTATTSHENENGFSTIADDTSNIDLSLSDDEDLTSHDGSSNDEDSDIDDDTSELSDIINENWEEGIVEDIASITSNEQYTVNQALKKCRGFIKTVNKSSTLTNFINHEKKQAKDEIKISLIIDCKSRWSSTHDLIKSVLVHKSIICQLFAKKFELNLTRKQETKLLQFELSREEWIILEYVLKILNAFFEATNMISGKKYVTIGVGFSAIANIKDFLEERSGIREIDRLKHLLLKELQHYFENDYEQWELIKRYAYYDPIGYATLDRTDRTAIEREIKALHKEYLVSPVHSNAGDSSPSITTEGQSKSKSSNPFQRFLSSVGKRHSGGNKQDAVMSIANELSLYRSLAVKEFNDVVEEEKEPDALSFWNLHGSQMKFLASLARKYLIVPSTSVPSESTFSIAAFIGRKERNRLTPENLSMLVFLKDKTTDDT